MKHNHFQIQWFQELYTCILNWPKPLRMLLFQRYISYTNVPAEGIKYITKLLQFNIAQNCRDCRNCSVLHLSILLSKRSTCTLEYGQYNHFIFEVQTLNYALNLKYGPLQKQINKKMDSPFSVITFFIYLSINYIPVLFGSEYNLSYQITTQCN